MSHLDEQISEALTHGPDTLTYILAQEVTASRARVAELEARKSGIEWMPMDSAPTATWSKAILCDSSGFVGVGMLDGKWLWYHNDKLAFPRFWAPLPAPPDRLRANQGGAAT